MNAITTHVLDTAAGRPAVGVPVRLEVRAGASWKNLAASVTNNDGRVNALYPEKIPLQKGVYRITFDTGTYFKASGTEAFYPEASVVFEIRDTTQHYHVPLLLNPYGYSTYRGS